VNTKLQRCPSCDGTVIEKNEGLIRGLYCDSCSEWLVVTTNYEDVPQNENCFTIIAQGLDAPLKKEHYRILAAVLNLGYADLYKKLNKSGSILYSGPKEKVNGIEVLLDEMRIPFQIK